MDGFSQRQKAFEAKYSQEEELEFRITARRNRLLGLWAAERMGRVDDDAEAYAQEVIMADFERVTHQDMMDKIIHDLDEAGAEVSMHKLSKELERCHQVAREMILKDESL